jgi:branched-chain amino acid transport system permease protein
MKRSISDPAPVPIDYRTEDTARELHVAIFVVLALALAVAPFVLYPIFVMKVMCYAMFACSFNLLLGFGGMLSFGQSAFFATGSYLCAF